MFEFSILEIMKCGQRRGLRERKEKKEGGEGAGGVKMGRELT